MKCLLMSWVRGDNDNLENTPIDGNEISVAGSCNPEGDSSGVNIDA